MLEIIQSLLPFPSGVPGSAELRAGWRHSVPLSCRKCRDRPCLSTEHAADHLSHRVCPRGASFYSTQIGSTDVRLIGLLDAELNADCPKGLRRALRDNRVNVADVQQAVTDLQERMGALDRAVSHDVREALAGLHDVKTATNVVYRCMEEVVASYDGTTDVEKIERADVSIRGLLESIALLKSRLDSASIAANPAAAAYGQQRNTPVYRVFHRMVKLFAPLARDKGVRIAMSGASYNAPPAYASFETVALVLIDNAVKYALRNTDVVVLVRDEHPASVRVCITSVGPLVPEAETDRIFERGYRGTSATGYAASGSGIGLHTAAVVARAHGFDIRYAARAPATAEVGENAFFFVIAAPGSGGAGATTTGGASSVPS